MSMKSGALAKQLLAQPASAGFAAPDFNDLKSADYGGFVGKMLEQLDAKMGENSAFSEVNETPEDFLHVISVTCGYLGLILGFFASAFVLSTLF